jgi:predicted anti-sigma-YlaC factor YlaD
MSSHLAPDFIDAYLDGELSAEDRAAVQRHLEQCSTCGADLERRRSLFEVIEGIPEAPPPRDAAENIVATLRQRRARARVLEWLLLPQILIAAALIIFAMPGLARTAGDTLAPPGLNLNLDAFSEQAHSVSSRLDQVWERSASTTRLDVVADLLERLRQSGEQALTWIKLDTLPSWTWWTIAAAASVCWLLGNGLLLQAPSRRAVSGSNN